MPRPFELVRQVEQTVIDYSLLNHGDRILVGVSGGADSVCLLLVLRALAKPWQLRLHAFHLNHRLRGKDAGADERFVKWLCEKLRIPCTTTKADVRGCARRHRLSIEEAGRELRYQLMQNVAKELKCTKVAVAHNANDNAETVVMNLVRGSGLTGISGIPVQRPCPIAETKSNWELGVGSSEFRIPHSALSSSPIAYRLSAIALVRPLIRIERKAIERFLKEQGVGYRHDLSNVRLEFRRNLVRHKVLPLLEGLNPGLVPALSRTSEILRRDDALLAEQTRQALRRVAKRTKDGYCLDTRRLLKYNVSIRRRILKTLIPELSFDEVGGVLEIATGPFGRKRTLSGQYVAWQEHRGLFLERKTPNRPTQSEATGSRVLKIPGRNRLPFFGVTLKTMITPLKAPKLQKLPSRAGTEVFDLEQVHLPLEVRQRRPGDRFAPFGARTRKLQDILTDDKIPQRLRDRIPVLSDQRGILWAIGSRRSNRAPITPSTRKLLTVSIRRPSNHG